VVVEAPVLDGDDRPWKILAEALEAHGLAALFHPELPDLVPVGVVNVGVLHKLGVLAVEALPILPDHKKVRADQHRQGHDDQDKGEVEEESERAENETAPALFGGLLACLEEAVHDLPFSSLPYLDTRGTAIRAARC
jgi:hypothetical protein